MKKYALVAASAALMTVAAPASAVTLITFAPNSNALPSWVGAGDVSVVEDFNVAVANGTPFSNGLGLTGTATGDVRLYNSNVSGQATGPVPYQGTFLSILNGSYTATLASPVQVFSFLLGGLDGYNSVTLNYAGGGSDLLNGLAIIGAAPANTTPINLANTGQTGRVTYDRQGGPGIVSVVFRSSRAALEIDGLVSAAPEPGTWGMMIVGFGLAGAALRVRRRDSKLAQA